MVGVSYHELNAMSGNVQKTERHTAGERKQFLVVCVVGVAVLLNAFIGAGLMEPVMIRDDGIYPGGDFVYKMVEDKDYSSTGGLWRLVRGDLTTAQEPDDSKFDDDLYSVYIDKPEGCMGRFFVGLLSGPRNADLKQKLLQSNVDNKMKTNENEFIKMEYDLGDLPSVRSAVATFPFTDGFVSGLLHNYKVFPALAKYARANLNLGTENGGKLVISTTCNREKQMCTHYVPMIQGEKFLMGHSDTEEYLKNGGDFESISVDLQKTIKGLKKMVGMN
eukprot:CAMPEP_0197258410 /NCGR_PEP_ID=MMETSP1429-20130617/81973_1 /TAXON_ID=49237 /ORGANISM="Chaetoceros  sp., Strain UNC1202" /LENGTH=275 /DNA_ID=CAMNT_0042722513 /DNA_START=51 /DNA_END=878 /DNA_ORIENTATION=-